MKRYTLYILVAILGMLNIQPAEAQQKNDQNALYIFRNDGGFNAFFFADIERIEYSKIDTLGHEQSDYVVQEIYAMDSIFRIPVSAIDSVAFVTPKNKVKEDVVCPDKTMTDYIVASDSVSWFRLSASAPSSIIPKVGDKLLIENPVKYLPDGFSGKVTKVSNGSDGTTIETDPLALEDLFDRFIAKAAASSNASVAAVTRGLISGISDEYVNQDVIELPVLSGSFSPATFSGDAFKAFNDNFAISLEGTASGSYTLTPKITDFRAFIYADIIEGVKYSQYMKMDNEAQIALTASGTIGANLDIPLEFGADKIDGILKNNRRTYAKNFGLFCVDFSYGWFFNGKGSVNSSISYGLKGGSLSTVSYDEPFFHIPVKEDFKVNMSSNCSDGEWEVDGWGYGLSVSTGIYAKAEAKIRFLGRTWQTEARAEAGVRFEENTSVEPAEAGGTEILETPALYTKAFANDNVTRAYYGGIQLSVKKGIGMGVDYSIFNYSNELTFGKRELFYSVPDMKSIKWEVDNKAPWRGTLTVPLEKELLFPKQVGLAVFDVTDAEKPQQVVNYWKTGSYINNKAYSQIKEVVETLEPSKQYTAYPQVKLYNYPILADKQVNVALGAPMMDIKPKAVEFDENPGYKDIEVITNVKNTEFTTEDAWLNETKPTWNNEEGRLTVHAPALPDGTDTRKGYVIGVGYDKEGKELLRDTVTITQLRPILQASPNPVQFEQKGGTIKVTLNTTLSQIEATIQEGGNLDKFFTMTLNADNTITVTAPENTTGKELSGNIIVKGTSPGGQKAELNLNVTQKSGAAEEPEMTLSTEKMTFDHNSGSMDFTVHVAGGVTLKTLKTSQKNDSSGKKWLDWVLKDKSDPNNRVYTVTVTENNDGEARTGTIELTARNDDGTVEIAKTLTITQEAKAEESDLKIDYVQFSMDPQKLSQQYKDAGGSNSYFGFGMIDKEAKIVKNGNRYTVTGNFAKKNNSTSGAMAPTEEFALNGDYMNTCDYKFTFYKDSQDGWYYLESADIKYHDHGEINFINYLHEGTMSVSNGKYYMQSPYGPDHNKYQIRCEDVEMTGTSRIWQWFDEGSKYVKYDISVNDEVWSTIVRVEFK
ncbi:MAG: hypothetical protein IJQ04_01150 [Prevotella sp.]|nr:hypothetical protein [Prevotella sp.]